MRLRLLTLAAVAAALLAACASGGASPPSSSPSRTSVLPVIISSELVVGPNRFLFSFIDPVTNAPVAAPDRTASVAFFIGDTGGTPAATANGTFIWAIEGERGVYVANVTFPSAGPWTAAFTTAAPGKPTETIPFGFNVLAKGSAVQVGQPAPSTKTPTLADVGGGVSDVKKLSTDASPDPAFYQVSEDRALAEHKPFVLVFATPAFCTSRQCGPTLDHAKAIAKQFPSVTFINVEPYKLRFANGQLQPILDAQGQLQPTDVTNAWGILSEPWVYVVDRTGIVRGSFEGVVGQDELTAAIDAVK